MIVAFMSDRCMKGKRLDARLDVLRELRNSIRKHARNSAIHAKATLLSIFV